AEREKAEALADEKGKLASKNAKLAADEHDAKNKAVAAQQEKEKQLQRTQATLFTRQVELAGQIYEKDSRQARRLLADTESCPVDLRDLAWNFIDHACQRRQGPQIRLPGVLGAISPDGKWLAAVNTVAKIETQEVPRGVRRNEFGNTSRPR